MPGVPALIPLAYGTVYCELCRTTLPKGTPVGWWTVVGKNGHPRPAAYCADCHRASVRQGRPLRASR
jgi:hypothetical protein